MTIPQIFDRFDWEMEVPEGFTAVKISLDGSVSSSLSWKESEELAVHFVQRGLQLFWEIDLGFFSNLEHPLSDEAQCLSLGLSLRHFTETVGNRFAQETIGVSLYSGSVDFSHLLSWDEELLARLRGWLQESFPSSEPFWEELSLPAQKVEKMTPLLLQSSPVGSHLLRLFCRSVVTDYFHVLARELPPSLPLFLLFDVTDCGSDWQIAQLLSREFFPHFELCVAHSPLKNSCWRWGGGMETKGNVGRHTAEESSAEESSLGICLPPADLVRLSHYTNFPPLFDFLRAKELRYRLIPEVYLTDEWHDLDYLFVQPQTLSTEGRRKLLGFCAAGGQVVSLGEKIGVPEEKSWKEFFSQPEF